jgi:hypothetical protein
MWIRFVCHSEEGAVVGCCGNGNGTLGNTKDGGSFDRLQQASLGLCSTELDGGSISLTPRAS